MFWCPTRVKTITDINTDLPRDSFPIMIQCHYLLPYPYWTKEGLKDIKGLKDVICT